MALQNRMWVMGVGLLAGALLSAAGCGSGGPPVGQVSGVVTLDNQPLPKAQVTFQPREGSPSYGQTDANGRYELVFTVGRKGAQLGEHTVSVSTYLVEGTDDGGKVEHPEKVPAKYRDNSELRATVASGKQEHNISLQSQ